MSEEMQIEDFDLDQIEVDLDEVQKEISRAKGENTGPTGPREQYYGGKGKNWGRLVPFKHETGFKHLIRYSFHPSKKTGYVDENGKPLDILCPREMWGEDCPICERRFHWGKELGWKNTFVKSLWPDDRWWGVFLLVSDAYTCQKCRGKGCDACSGTGIADVKRFKDEGYVNGDLYQTRFEFGDPSLALTINDRILDPDWGPIYHPKMGRDICIEITTNSGGHRQYSIEFRPQTSQMGDRLGWADGTEAEWKKRVNQAIMKANDLAARFPQAKLEKPSPVMLAAVGTFLDGKYQEAKGLKTPKDQETDSSEGSSYTQPPEEPQEASETSKDSGGEPPAEEPTQVSKPAQDVPPAVSDPEPKPDLSHAVSKEDASDSFGPPVGDAVDFKDLVGLPKGPVKFSDGKVISGPVPMDVTRPEDGKRACWGLFNSFTEAECTTSCGPDVAFPCMQECAERKKKS